MLSEKVGYQLLQERQKSLLLTRLQTFCLVWWVELGVAPKAFYELEDLPAYFLPVSVVCIDTQDAFM